MPIIPNHLLWTVSWLLGPAVIGAAIRNGRVWTIPVDSHVQHGPTLLRLALPAAIPTALLTAAARLGTVPRLVLGGYGTLRADQLAAHRLLVDAGVDHRYYDGPPRQHRWDSGWLPHALDELARLATWPR